MNMQAEELRIGNFVLKDDKYRKVEAISIPYHHLLSLKNNALLERAQFNEIKPIPLTEEILLKCGFEKLGKYTFVCDTALMQLEIDVVTNKLVHSILAIEVKHLHQLQNLHHALTGQELNIKGL